MTGGVQSVARAFGILEVLAGSDGELSVSELAQASGLPLPTIHRLVRTLVDLGHVHQLPNRRYTLGPGLIGLGDRASRLLGARVGTDLASLAERIGETANMAVLDGERAVYTAQVPSRHSMRTFTEVGRRVFLHSTGVGKALLAQLPAGEARRLLETAGMPGQTGYTVVDVETLLDELDAIRLAGHAVDAEEQEDGVFCVAVPVPGAPSPAAISVSGPTSRFFADRTEEAATLLREAATRLAGRFA
ncbi:MULTISPECIES: IclR family transcriptional regulator [Pseudonocardia]|uniref:Glycerol operon regulatory protein n=2 Tax=Pseudonocardia TaxID=1847 RepID=A0A1Y2MRU3_PSEAH|nr:MULTISPECIES: IclR family transcriptional regulator [Pseudonocardia]OSY37861.1 Transcriptional regulator KdgR [Pseudonocardia autotrophica]TDN72476.1 IclR family transcriptional regulator [Pseudonocardia autotrophica]BBG03185.1 IclR family transcriptional regulator [Pseudonocardia autotrophica]GEC23801.1 IclR family transcriptional regulator [Pseudonocardia saturnea]